MAKRPIGDHWRIGPGTTRRLATIDPRSRAHAPGGKARTRRAADELRDRLADLQNRLYAEGERSLLLVLQAMDAGGKDGTIRSVFSGTNPQGVRVASFGVPTARELDHDFLWRIHAQAPARGQIGVFNRSHYEDVLVARVHATVREEVWRARYPQIRAFEETLAAAGTTIVKVMLHISPDEQRARLQERIDDPVKRWKFNPGDLPERARWEDYQAAFQEAIARTTTKRAPWFVVPADRNWYRDWAVLTILVEALERMDPQFPPAREGVAGLVVT